MEPPSTVTAVLNSIGVVMTGIQGFGRLQLCLLCYCGLAWFGDAAEIMLISFLGPALRCGWGLSPSAESALTSVVFAGMLFGVYSLGAIADAVGRRRGFLASALTLAAAGLASALSPSFGWLLATRAVVGFALGGTPIAVTLFVEWVPSQRRGRWLLAMQSFWTVGTLFEALLAWAVLPHLSWRWLVALSATPLLLLLLLFPWLPESPHWLAAQGRHDEAEAVLRRAAAANGRAGLCVRLARPGEAAGAAGTLRLAGRPAAVVLVESAEGGEGGGGGAVWAQARAVARRSALALAAIFAPKLRATTCLLYAIWFVNAIVYYGLVLLSTALQTSGGKGGHCWGGRLDLSSAEYLAVVINTAAEAPGLLLCALAVDRIGRRSTIRSGLLLCAAALLALLAAPPPGVQLALLFVARGSIEGTFTVLYIYTPEVYSTAVRAFGLSLCNAFSRSGGFLAPFATVYLVDSGHPRAAEALLGTLCLLAATAAFRLPYETQGRDLQRELGSDEDGDGGREDDPQGQQRQQQQQQQEEEDGQQGGWGSAGRGSRSSGEAELVGPSGDRVPLLAPAEAAAAAAAQPHRS